MIFFLGGFQDVFCDVVYVFCVVMIVMVCLGMIYDIGGVVLFVLLLIVVGVVILMFCDLEMLIYLVGEFDVVVVCDWIIF